MFSVSHREATGWRQTQVSLSLPTNTEMQSQLKQKWEKENMMQPSCNKSQLPYFFPDDPGSPVMFLLCVIMCRGCCRGTIESRQCLILLSPNWIRTWISGHEGVCILLSICTYNLWHHLVYHLMSDIDITLFNNHFSLAFDEIIAWHHVCQHAREDQTWHHGDSCPLTNLQWGSEVLSASIQDALPPSSSLRCLWLHPNRDSGKPQLNLLTN